MDVLVCDSIIVDSVRDVESVVGGSVEPSFLEDPGPRYTNLTVILSLTIPKLFKTA